MTTQKMTPKSFLFKSGTKAANSASAFLAQYRSFLESGELASVTGPILAQVDSKVVFPTEGLALIRNAVLAHHIQAESRKAEERMMRAASDDAEGKPSKPWSVVCYDAKGNVCQRKNDKGELIDLAMSFDLQQRASEWADRRLVNDCASDCFAVITHGPTGLDTVSLYVDAMGRQNPKVKGAASKKVGSRDSKLSWGCKVSQSHAHFSHG
jgi:hypothetical protein